MIAGEGVEGAHLHPSAAKLLSGVVGETADVSAHHGHAKHSGVDNAHHRVFQILPCSLVVTGPVRGVRARAHERRPREDKRPLLGHGRQSLLGDDGLGQAIQVVCVVLQCAIVMLHSHGNGLVTEVVVMTHVVNFVRRIVETRSAIHAAKYAMVVAAVILVQEPQIVALEGACRPGAKIGRFVHVNPKPVEWHLVEEISHLSRPPRGRLGVQKVREVDGARPHLRQVVVSEFVLEEDVVFQAALQRAVVFVGYTDACRITMDSLKFYSNHQQSPEITERNFETHRTDVSRRHGKYQGRE